MKHDALKQPFFVQLLEVQKTPTANEQFYPWTTKPAADQAQTQKYPSDGDDDNWPEPF